MSGKQAGRAWLNRMREAGEASLDGFSVEASDGTAGRIDRVLYWSDSRRPDFVVVGTGRWFFGHKSVLPIDVIEDVDIQNRRLRVSLSKKQVRRATESLPCT